MLSRQHPPGGLAFSAITASLTLIYAGNDPRGPLVHVQIVDRMTPAVARNSFQNQYGDFGQAHLLKAAGIVTMISCIVLFFGAQRQLVNGLILGGVKG